MIPIWLIKYLLLLLLLLVPFTAVAQPGESIPLESATEITLLAATTPIPTKVKLPPSIFCNCWAYVKSVYPLLPGTNYILNHLSASGNVAVFYYPKNGLHHYAVVLYEAEGHYVIEETNYHHCTKTTREIKKDDPTLLGFFHI